jgi:hypothetical protein
VDINFETKMFGRNREELNPGDIHASMAPDANANTSEVSTLQKAREYFQDLPKQINSEEIRKQKETLEQVLAKAQENLQTNIEEAIKAAGEKAQKTWEAARANAVPILKAAIKQKKAELTTVSGATGLLTTMVAKGALKRATLSGVRTVGNVAAPLVGTIAGAVVGGAWGAGSEMWREYKRVKSERSFDEYEKKIAELTTLDPTVLVERYVAAQSLLDTKRGKFELNGFYGTDEQLEALQAKLHAVDLRTAIAADEWENIDDPLKRLAAAFEVRGSAEEELTLQNEADRELLKSLEHKLGSSIDSEKIKRGLKVGMIMGGLGGLAGSIIGSVIHDYFGTVSVHANGVETSDVDARSDALHASAQTEVHDEVVEEDAVPSTSSTEVTTADSSDHQLSYRGGLKPSASADGLDEPLVQANEVHAAAPAADHDETTTAPSPEASEVVSPVTVEQTAPVIPEAVEPTASFEVPEIIALEKGGTVWDTVELYLKNNGIKPTNELVNNLTKQIADENGIRIEGHAPTPGVEYTAIDTKLEVGKDINLHALQDYITEHQNSSGHPVSAEIEHDASPEVPGNEHSTLSGEQNTDIAQEGVDESTETVAPHQESTEAPPETQEVPLQPEDQRPTYETDPSPQADEQGSPASEASSPDVPSSPVPQSEFNTPFRRALRDVSIGVVTSALAIGGAIGVKKYLEHRRESSVAAPGNRKVSSESSRSPEVNRLNQEFIESQNGLREWDIHLERSGVLVKDYKEHAREFNNMLNGALHSANRNGSQDLWHGMHINLVRAGEPQRVEDDKVYIDITNIAESRKVLLDYIHSKRLAEEEEEESVTPDEEMRERQEVSALRERFAKKKVKNFDAYVKVMREPMASLFGPLIKKNVITEREAIRIQDTLDSVDNYQHLTARDKESLELLLSGLWRSAVEHTGRMRAAGGSPKGVVDSVDLLFSHIKKFNESELKKIISTAKGQTHIPRESQGGKRKRQK